MKLYGVKKINPVAREMLQKRKSPQVVESKKDMIEIKKQLKKIVLQKLEKCLNNASLYKTFEKNNWRT